jgi:hypothetical protein
MNTHDLRQLAELPGPEWRLPAQQRNELCLVRAFEYYVETVCIVDGGLVAVSRCPIAGRSPHTIAAENFAGSFRDAIDVLRQPPHWETEETRTIAWPTPANPDPPQGIAV